MEIRQVNELNQLREENLSLKEALAEHTTRLESDFKIISVLYGLTTVPIQASSLKKAAQRVLDLLVQDQDDLDNCSLLLFDEHEQLLRLLAARGQSDLSASQSRAYNRSLSFRPGDGLAGLAFSNNEPYFWNQDSPEAHLLKRSNGLGIPNSLASLPLTPMGRRLGILNLSFQRQRPFDHLRRRNLILLSGGVGNAIQGVLMRNEPGAYAIPWERRQAGEGGQPSEGGLQMVSEAVTDLIWTLDLASMRFSYLSPSVHALTGYTVEEAMGLRLDQVFTADSYHRFQQVLDTTLNNQQIAKTNPNGKVELELKQLRKDGSTLHVGVAISGLRDPEGKLTGLMGISRDISESKRLQRQVRQAHKMEAVGTLAGGVAHDFNNILQVIAGCTELIARSGALDNKAARHLAHINRATEKAADLVEHLLTFSRRVEPTLELVDLNHLVRQAKQLLIRLIPKMITLKLDLADDLAKVNADPNQLEQILLNLATNARDAMPDGGRLLLKTCNQTLDKEFCARNLGSQAGRYACLVVSDNGQGMSPLVLRRIFEPFYTTKGVGQGTGLGLAVVYGTVKNHQGYITCQSEPGQGTTFHIYLPAVDAQASPQPLAEPKEDLRGGDENILLVDDEPALLEAGQEILNRWGYSVKTASNGEQAIAAIQKSRPDLVILDLGMPGMGGEACLRELLYLDPELKVVIATGYSHRGQSSRFLQAGASGFLGKPYSVASLIRLVRQVLDQEV